MTSKMFTEVKYPVSARIDFPIASYTSRLLLGARCFPLLSI